jgi:hypothetical protein
MTLINLSRRPHHSPDSSARQAISQDTSFVSSVQGGFMQFSKSATLLCSIIGTASFCVASASLAQEAQAGHGKPEPPMMGIHWAKGHEAKPGGGGNSPDLIWHGGPIMTSSVVQAIFWGPSWADATFTADKMTGVHSFYAGMNKSGYANTVSEYVGTNGQVGNSITYAGGITDLSAAPSHAPKTSDILAEVCKEIASPVTNGFYAVYIDQPRDHAGYCAWHSAGTCGGTSLQFAFFFNLDGDAGCDPEDTSGLHSQGMAALANVSGHELSEARSDPQLNGWYDNNGAENADKCAWVFGTPLLRFSDRSMWKVQGNWSNHAYDASLGYANRAGQLGCLDGGNYQ